MAIATTDPRTGEVVRTYDELTAGELFLKVRAASAAAATYRHTTFDQRAGWLRKAADLLDERNAAAADMMTLEMGKTRKAAGAEATKSASALRFYADHGADYLADEPVDASSVGASQAFGRYLPIGVVLAIMPWNFPLWQAMRFAAPALMAGNVGLLKHASNVPKTALFMEQLFRDAGFPDDVFQTLLIGSNAVKAVIQDPRVAAATLTGSEAAGVSVGRIAGEALKKVVLELGGSDPFVVMPSADLAASAKVATTARCQNNGQSCIAAKRFIVHVDVYDEWLALFKENMAALVVGDPMEEGTDVGPLATEQGRDEVAAQVKQAISDGATVELGGEQPDGPGWWYPPTIISNITREMDLYHEEVFGPVASVFKVASIDEAIHLANDTRFGLGANAWTTDHDEQHRFIQELEAGQTFINGMTTSYPALPFGGVKASGHGRELSAAGIREFCNLKTVWVACAFDAADPLSVDALLTDEELAVRASVRKLADDRIAPYVADWFERGELDDPRGLARDMGAIGLLGMHLSGYGCAGLGAVAYGVACLELEAVDSGIRSMVSVQGSLAMYPIWKYASEELKQEWLPRMATGEAIGCFGLTEPDQGSDPGGMRTRAVRDGDDWVLNGRKMWITNGSIADVAVVWARAEDGIRGFVVPTDTPGFSAPLIKHKMSLRASITSELVLDDVRVPAGNALDVVGLKGPLSCLSEARFGIIWGSVGAARSSYLAAVDYAKTREQFGKPIAGYQLTQQKLAEMALIVGKSQLLSLHLGRLKEKHELLPEQVSFGKLNNVRDALDVCRSARTILGANGISLEYPVIRHMNNLESVLTYEGTVEMHTLVLGQAITGLSAFR